VKINTFLTLVASHTDYFTLLPGNEPWRPLDKTLVGPPDVMGKIET